MKTKTLLLLCGMTFSSFLMATVRTVTTSAALGEGSLVEVLTAAVDNDSIHFNFDGTVLEMTNVYPMKSITINGLNAFNNQRVVLKQVTAAKNFLTLATGVTAKLNDLIFDGSGGATTIGITAANGSTLNINNCVFRNINAAGASNGSAGRIQGVANISNTIFQSNSCDGGYGGGALCMYNAANVTIDKCSFIGNTSKKNGNSGGGAIVARGTVASGPCNVKITNSTFANNASEFYGGAILSTIQSSSVYTANVTAVNCTFTGNKGDGAISTLTTAKGNANIYLINSIVTNNINAAGDAYSDLLETKGTDPATVVTIEPHNVIYSVASSTVVTAGRNCVQVADLSTADIFNSTETFATDKKRPLLSTANGQTVAMISSSSIAKASGVATLSGYTIPSVDQLGETRPTTPTVGAVEFKDLSTAVAPNILVKNELILSVNKKSITINGLVDKSEFVVYGLTGNILYKAVVNNNEPVSLEGLQGNLFIIKVQNQSFKVLLK